MATTIQDLINNQIVGQGNQVRASVLVQVLQGLLNGSVSMGAPDAFDATDSYSKGDLVTYNDKWYQFNTSHTGAWNAAHADEVTLLDLYSALEERVAALEA